MKSVYLPVVCLAFAAMLGSGGGEAQQKAAPSQEPSIFGETIDVRVVNVEVVVTDKDGNRVSGLKPGDFHLKVDGKEVPVTYFSEIAGGQSMTATTRRSPSSRSTSLRTNRRNPAGSSSTRPRSP